MFIETSSSMRKAKTPAMMSSILQLEFFEEARMGCANDECYRYSYIFNLWNKYVFFSVKSYLSIFNKSYTYCPAVKR